MRPNGGLIVTASALAAFHRVLIITLAARHGLPAVYSEHYSVVDGGLISYATGAPQHLGCQRVSIARGDGTGDFSIVANHQHDPFSHIVAGRAAEAVAGAYGHRRIRLAAAAPARQREDIGSAPPTTPASPPAPPATPPTTAPARVSRRGSCRQGDRGDAGQTESVGPDVARRPCHDQDRDRHAANHEVAGGTENSED